LNVNNFFAYDERTIDMVNEARVVNFVIQNSLDVYKTQRKRFTRITVDDKFNEEDYEVERKMQYESTYEVQDVIEVRSLFQKDIEGGQHYADVVPDVVLVSYKKNGLLGQVKPQEYVVPRKVHELYMTLNKGISNKMKKKQLKIFKRITDIGLDPVIGFSNYEISDRVLQKRELIDPSPLAESKDLKRKRKKN